MHMHINMYTYAYAYKHVYICICIPTHTHTHQNKEDYKNKVKFAQVVVGNPANKDIIKKYKVIKFCFSSSFHARHEWSSVPTYANTYIHTCMHKYVHFACSSFHAHTYIHIHTYMYAYTCTCSYI